MKHFFHNRLLPAVTIEDVEAAKRLADAYAEAGLDTLEFTLRTEATLDAIEAVAKEFPDCNVGAGTILSKQQVSQAIDAGAEFGLSPGFNAEIVEEAHTRNFPFVPGVMTPSEIELALSHECGVLKVFPVRELGGVDFIRSMEGPYAQTGVRFIPMGGVDMDNMVAYLERPTVLAVGGSWLAPATLIETEEYPEITRRVRRSMERVRSLKLP